MWRHIKKYLPLAVLGGFFMVGEVAMELQQPGLMSRIVDEGVLGLAGGSGGGMELIWKLGIRMLFLVFLGGLCGVLNNVFVNISSQNMGNEIRKDCFRQIMSFSFPQVDQFGNGSLVTRVTNDIVQVQNLVSQFVRGMVRTGMLMFGSIYCMFHLNRDFGLIVLCAFPLIVGCLFFCLIKANPLFSKMQMQIDTINEIMQEDVSGIRMIKACVRELYEKLRFGKANDELIKTQLRVLVLFAFMNPVINAMMYIVIAVIILVGSFDVQNGRAIPGHVMAAITYTTQLLNGILMLVMLFQNISRGMASWKRIKEILDCSPQLKDGTFDGTMDKRGEIEFRDVSFAYPGSSQTALSHINLTIHKGETLAVMGASGCGKTSFVNLIPRFYDVSEGMVLVDGVDVRKYQKKALREKIAVVMQKSELFCTSNKENIAWGSPGALDEDIHKAADTSQAHDFISQMPDGYQTQVAQRGMSLSGGQKQRVSIARAVLKQAEILIFDDSTSALDLKTEADFYMALQKCSPESTKIIIAQRIASVRRADRIAVLDHGRVVACASHKELMQFCPEYQSIYDSQMGEEEQRYA